MAFQGGSIALEGTLDYVRRHMSVRYITAVQMADGGTQHEHIAFVLWQKDGSSKAEWVSRQAAVDWLREDDGNKARVIDPTDSRGRGYVSVKVRPGPPPFLQTKADGEYQDNLLSLPGGPKGPALR